MSEQTKILLIGTGAIGSYFGGRLAQAGALVSAVCRSDYSKVAREGISIKSHLGDFHFRPHEVLHSIDLYDKNPDYILVATKVLPNINVAELIKKKISSSTAIVLIQNGIEIENEVATAFPGNEIVSALAFICVSRVDSGCVEHTDFGRIVIGNYPTGATKKVNHLSLLFNSVGVQCSIEHNIVLARWKKLVWNAPFNPLSVLAGCVTTTEMINNHNMYILAKNIMEEIALVATESGYAIDQSVIEKNLNDTMIMKPYKTSMLLDFENKKPMEIEAILGNTIRIAARLEIKVPNIFMMYSLLKMLDVINIKTAEKLF